MEQKIEAKVAATILQDKLEVRVGTEVYRVAPPTLTTLIKVSEIISRLPNVESDELSFALNSGKEAKLLTDIVATLILGENLNKSYLFGLIKRGGKLYNKIKSDALKMSVAEISNLIAGLMATNLESANFTMLITFLKRGSLTKPTKTIQSGR